jgi:hypothetical protein
MEKERRQYARNELKYFARVYNRKIGRLIGYLVNINPIGVMVISEKPIDPGASVGLHIDFSESLDCAPNLDLDAKCVWSRPDKESEFFELGFKLPDLREEQVRCIEQIVKRYGFEFLMFQCNKRIEVRSTD